MAASFNLGGSAPASTALVLDAGTDSIVSAAVKTRAASARQRALEYTYPGLSGGGASAQGIAPVPIDWVVQAEFSSFNALVAWEAKAYAIIRAGGRYALVDELGQSRSNVWLFDYSRTDANPILGSATNWLLEVVLSFKWMQP